MVKQSFEKRHLRLFSKTKWKVFIARNHFFTLKSVCSETGTGWSHLRFFQKFKIALNWITWFSLRTSWQFDFLDPHKIGRFLLWISKWNHRTNHAFFYDWWVLDKFRSIPLIDYMIDNIFFLEEWNLHLTEGRKNRFLVGLLSKLKLV